MRRERDRERIWDDCQKWTRWGNKDEMRVKEIENWEKIEKKNELWVREWDAVAAAGVVAGFKREKNDLKKLAKKEKKQFE